MRAGVTVIRRQGLGVGMVWAAVLVAPLPASAEPAVEAPGQEAPPERLGPVAIHTGHGTDRVQVGAAAQLRATLTSDDLGSAPEDVDLSVALQRLRLKTSGHFLDDALEFRLQVNLTPQQAELIDAWASYRFDPRALLSLGQMKVPFTAYRAGSFSSLVLADWGETSRWFGSERQLGILVETPLKTEFPLVYSVGIFQGDNSRGSFSNRLSQVYGEVSPNRSSFSEPASYGDPHPEFVGRLSYRLSQAPQPAPQAKKLKLGFHLSGAYDLTPTLTEDATVRLAPELSLDVSGAIGVRVSAIYYAAWATLSDASPAPGSTPLAYQGPQLEAGFRFLKNFEVAFRYGIVFVADALNDDARLRAQGIVQGPDPIDSAAASRYQSAGSFSQTQEITTGFNWYFVGDSLKWQTDASLLPTESTSRTWTTDARARTQVQLAF